VVVPEWIPVVKELQVRGITDPVLIVGVFTTYEIPVASGQLVVGRLPRALATVAFVLGRDVKTAFVARSYSPASAATLLSELRALASKLDGLPGVNGPPRFAGGEPAQLANGVRSFAAMGGIPTPTDRAKEGRAFLSTLPEVASVEEVPQVLPPEPAKVHRQGDELIAPPWEAFPEEPTSLRWRMGAGEDYLDRWMPFWRGLPDSVRRDYLIGHPPPAAWREWLGRI